jgi:hypothetical protein
VRPLALALLLCALEVRAAEPEVPRTAARTKAPSHEDCNEPAQRLHDGFFLRAETGVAWLRAGVRDSLGPPGRTSLRGIGQSTAILAGGTPWPGLVFGGSLWASRIDPTFVEGGVRREPDDDSVKWTLARVGPFVSFYPRPNAGFHADLALSIALAVESDEKGEPIEPGAAGPGLAIGLGHDWFVSSELSLGLFGRVALIRVTRESNGRDERTLGELLELGVSYTYH